MMRGSFSIDLDSPTKISLDSYFVKASLSFFSRLASPSSACAAASRASKVEQASKHVAACVYVYMEGINETSQGENRMSSRKKRSKEEEIQGVELSCIQMATSRSSFVWHKRNAPVQTKLIHTAFKSPFKLIR